MEKDTKKTSKPAVPEKPLDVPVAMSVSCAGFQILLTFCL